MSLETSSKMHMVPGIMPSSTTHVEQQSSKVVGLGLTNSTSQHSFKAIAPDDEAYVPGADYPSKTQIVCSDVNLGIKHNYNRQQSSEDSTNPSMHPPPKDCVSTIVHSENSAKLSSCTGDTATVPLSQAQSGQNTTDTASSSYYDSIKIPPRRKRHTKKYSLRCVVVSLLSGIAAVLFVLTLILLLAWVGFILEHHLSPVSGPAETTGHVGSNSSMLLGCYDPDYVKSVTIGNKTNMKRHNVKLYTEQELQVSIVNKYLKPSTNYSFAASSGNRSVALNYFGGNNPIYVARNASVKFSVTFVRNVSFSKFSDDNNQCGFQLFAFDSENNFANFFRFPDTTPSYFNASKCIPAYQNIANRTLTLPISKKGFYYFAASIKSRVMMNATIGGTLTSYAISKDSKVDCSLVSDNSKCTIQINNNEKAKDHRLCIIATSSGNSTYPVTIVVHNINIDSNEVSEGLLIAGVIAAVFLFCVTLPCACSWVYFCCKHYRNSHPPYIKL